MSREHAGAGTQEGTLLISSRSPHRTLPALCLAITAALAGCGTGAPGNAAARNAAPAAPPEIVPATAADLHEIVAASPAKVVVLNVWATWCGPCREEFPDLLRLGRAYGDRGVALLLVSGDFDDQLGAAREFLAAQGVDFRTYIKSGRDMEFIDGLNPEWSGALPATFIYAAGGRRRDYWQGKATYEEMERHVLAVLEATDPATP